MKKKLPRKIEWELRVAADTSEHVLRGAKYSSIYIKFRTDVSISLPVSFHVYKPSHISIPLGLGVRPGVRGSSSVARSQCGTKGLKFSSKKFTVQEMAATPGGFIILKVDTIA